MIIPFRSPIDFSIFFLNLPKRNIKNEFKMQMVMNFARKKKNIYTTKSYHTITQLLCRFAKKKARSIYKNMSARWMRACTLHI